MNRRALQSSASIVASLLVCGVIFYLQAYSSVATLAPGSIPVHHDDYNNYAAGGGAFLWSWNRPVSNYFIHLLGVGGPAWLSGAIRSLSVLFVLLSWLIFCQLLRPRLYWLLLPLFAIAVFSTPVIVEYARYTGMITHLTSGCLALMAVVALFRSTGAKFSEAIAGAPADPAERPLDIAWLLASVALLVLSAFAKEDFVLFYALSLGYAALRNPSQRLRLLIIGGVGLAVCAAAIVASKLLSASAFLGQAEKSSSYYVDISPSSVAATVLRYLLGVGHPAMQEHGQTLLYTLLLSGAAALLVMATRFRIATTVYFIAAVLALIAPYSVLPNHANAYYELIWLPMLVAAAVAAAIELVERAPAAVRIGAPVAVLALLAWQLDKADFDGRSSVAAWYDARGAANANVLAQLRADQAAIEQTGRACITGADAFSPWYMHDGQYLDRVMQLKATWYLLVDPAAPEYAGFAMSAARSKGRIVIVGSAAEFSADCTHINLQQAR